MPETYKATGTRRLTCSQNSAKIDTRSKHVYRRICALRLTCSPLSPDHLDDSTEMVGTYRCVDVSPQNDTCEEKIRS